MDPTSHISPPPLYQSYAEYVRHLQDEWPELAWLDRFMNTKVPGPHGETTVGICDLVREKLVYHDFSGDPDRLGDALSSNPQDSPLRVVVLTHVDSWDVNRQIVDVLGAKLDVDPRFLMSHFNHRKSYLEACCPGDISWSVARANPLMDLDKLGWNFDGDPFALPGAHSDSFCRVEYSTEFMSLMACESQDHLVGRF